MGKWEEKAGRLWFGLDFGVGSVCGWERDREEESRMSKCEFVARSWTSRGVGPARTSA